MKTIRAAILVCLLAPYAWGGVILNPSYQPTPTPTPGLIGPEEAGQQTQDGDPNPSALNACLVLLDLVLDLF